MEKCAWINYLCLLMNFNSFLQYSQVMQDSFENTFTSITVHLHSPLSLQRKQPTLTMVVGRGCGSPVTQSIIELALFFLTDHTDLNLPNCTFMTLQKPSIFICSRTKIWIVTQCRTYKTCFVTHTGTRPFSCTPWMLRTNLLEFRTTK
jgi:hypothetical protein